MELRKARLLPGFFAFNPYIAAYSVSGEGM